QVDFFPVTDASVLTNITIQFENKDLQFQNKDGVQKAAINILGTVTSITRRPVSNFEKTIEQTVPTEMLQAHTKNKSLFQQTVPLAPGRYRLNVIAKDVIGGNLSAQEFAINVPRLDAEKASTSSLVLADEIGKVPTRS